MGEDGESSFEVDVVAEVLVEVDFLDDVVFFCILGLSTADGFFFAKDANRDGTASSSLFVLSTNDLFLRGFSRTLGEAELLVLSFIL